MKLQHIAAFSSGSNGGNPAGVVICDDLPTSEVMKRVAADVGYSETVFAAPVGERWRVRFFAPEVEVDLVLDRPFLYCLVSEAGTIGFIGICTDPTAG